MHIAVSNLASDVTAHDLRQLFAPYGAVGMIHIAIDPQTGRSQGCGSVVMADSHAAQAAITGLHGTTHAGRVLTVHTALPGIPPWVSRQA